MSSHKNRWFQLVLLGAVLAVVMAGCAGTSFEMEEPLDPADILGAAQYAVVLELDGKSEVGPAKDQRQWTGTVSDIAWSAGQAWTGGERIEVTTPPVGSGFTFASSEQIDLEEANTVVVVVRDIVYQNRDMHLALVVLDKDWRPVAGTEAVLAAGINAAADAAGEASRPNSMIQVLEEAVGFNDSRNVDPETSSEPALVAAAREGAGIGGDSTSEKAALDAAWLGMAAEARQLSSELIDMPANAESELGIEWAWREAAIVPSAEFVATYEWIAAYFPGVGVIGPFALNGAGEPTVIMGFGPADSPVQLLAWQGKEAIPGQGESIATLDRWVSEELEAEPPALWISVNGTKDAKIEVLTRAEYDARVMDFFTVSEEAPEPED